MREVDICAFFASAVRASSARRERALLCAQSAPRAARMFPPRTVSASAMRVAAAGSCQSFSHLLCLTRRAAVSASRFASAHDLLC